MLNKNTDLVIILQGIVGSVAYGLATTNSDVDRLGIFAAPTIDFLGLQHPKESFVTNNPDSTLHEAGKAVRLMLGCNPTVLEILWLPDRLVEICTDHGAALREIRSAFLSAPRVRGAYLGYASEQFDRLNKRGNGTFSSDTARRTAKHARHLARLLIQGQELYQTGNLRIELLPDDVSFIRTFGDQVAGGNIGIAEVFLRTSEGEFSRLKSVLPEQPDTAMVEDWLINMRRDLFV